MVARGFLFVYKGVFLLFLCGGLLVWSLRSQNKKTRVLKSQKDGAAGGFLLNEWMKEMCFSVLLCGGLLVWSLRSQNNKLACFEVPKRWRGAGLLVEWMNEGNVFFWWFLLSFFTRGGDSKKLSFLRKVLESNKIAGKKSRKTTAAVQYCFRNVAVFLWKRQRCLGSFFCFYHN